MTVNQRRLKQLLFDCYLEGLYQPLADARLRFMNVQGGQLLVRLLCRLERAKINTSPLFHGLGHADSPPRFAEIDDMAAHAEFCFAKHLHSHMPEHVLDKIHVVLIVFVSRHGFDHRELGMMTAVNAFVSEIPANRINFVIAGQDQPLKV